MVRFPVIVTIFIAGCTSGSISNNAKVAGGSQTGGSSSSFSAGGSVHPNSARIPLPLGRGGIAAPF
jgi:hypothetical protein